MIYRKTYFTIKLTQGQTTLVDYSDYDLVSPYTWCVSKDKDGRCYAMTNITISKNKYGRLYLHRLIMNINDSKIHVDHISHITLDNRKSNLRICTNTQNRRNRIKSNIKQYSSIYKGVDWNKKSNKWRARINFNKKAIHLGLFNSEIEAAKAYDSKAKELFGEFACLNFSKTLE